MTDDGNTPTPRSAPDQAPTDGAGARRRRGRMRLAVSIVVPLAIVGVLVYLLASKGHQIAHAADRTSPGTLIAVTALALVTLVLRTEAVVACLNAMGARSDRRDIHAANSMTFLAALINHYVSSIVRGALLKRIDPVRAPTILQMVMVDTSTSLIEALVVAILIVISAGALKLAWWVPALIIAAGVAGVWIALVIRRRFAHLTLFRGLDVLAHSRQRVVVAVQMALVILIQVGRTFVVLQAVGLHPNLLQAVATFVAAGVLSSLFAGPGAGTAGGPLIVFGSSSLAASTAAGLELSITSLIAGIIYALGGAPVFVHRLRQTFATG